MKKLFKYLQPVCFIILVIFCSTLFYPYADVSEYAIYTRMTEIVLPPTMVYRENYPNSTFFEFNYTFEIINPSGKFLYILSHTTCLVFVSGNLSFENEQYVGHVGGTGPCGAAFTNYTIEPGITESASVFHLFVNDSLEALPDGNYSIWIFLDDSEEQHNYHNFPSEIAVNGSDIQITHNGDNETFTFPEKPTPAPTQAYFFVISPMVGILVFTIIRKKFQKEMFHIKN